MAVEILILSGARAGQQIAIAGDEFHAGAAADCEVFFDPREDPAAVEGSAVFRLMEDGWYAQPTGRGEIFINQDPLAKRTRLRSGDVVRMSHQGPDFSFTIVAHATATPASPRPEVQAPQGFAVEPRPAAAPLAPPLPPPSVAPLVTPAAAEATIAPALSLRVAGKSIRRLAWIGGAVAVVLVLAVLVIAGRSVPVHPPKLGEIGQQKAIQGQTLQVPIPLIDRGSFPETLQYDVREPAPPPPGARIDGARGLFTWVVPEDQAAGRYPITVQVAVAGREDLRSTATFVVEVDKRPARSPVLGKIEDQQAIPGKTLQVPPKPPDVRDAVYLIALERSNQLIPFATCCAINEKTLLTSGREAAQLVYFRKAGLEQRIWIRNEKGVKREVEEIRALRTFTRLFTEDLIAESKKPAPGREYPAAGNKPRKWLYFDVGLLTVEEKLPAFAPLASTEDLKALKNRIPLLCLGYAHDTKMIGEDQAESPKLQSGKDNHVYLITTASPPSDLPAVEGPPRLLHVDGEIPTQWVDDPKAVGRDPSAKRKVAIRPYGSPIFNQEGKLVAVYGDTTSPQGDELLLLHYAPVINPQLIDRWIGGQANRTEDTQTWSLPDVFSPPPESVRKP